MNPAATPPAAKPQQTTPRFADGLLHAIKLFNTTHRSIPRHALQLLKCGGGGVCSGGGVDGCGGCGGCGGRRCGCGCGGDIAAANLN